MANSTNSKKRKPLDKRTRTIIALAIVAILIAVIVYATGGHLELTPDGIAIVAPAPSPQEPALITPTPAATSTPAPTPAYDGMLEVYALDVGQGDCTFLRSPSGKTMLVDASESKHYDAIDDFLKAQGVEKLDVVIGTHPHSDHIGGMLKVVSNYEIGAYYMPDVTTNTRTFEKLIDKLDELDIDVFPAYAGLDALIEWDEQVEIRILSPFDGYEYDLNNASVVCRVKFGETSVLLTGDAEIPAEKIALNELPASYFSATILKMGHHGSSTSTGAALFDAVKPEAAFMSLGEDNSYGHPHREIIELLNGAKIPYYRTDESGIIHFTLDGTGWSVKTEK